MELYQGQMSQYDPVHVIALSWNQGSFIQIAYWGQLLAHGTSKTSTESFDTHCLSQIKIMPGTCWKFSRKNDKFSVLKHISLQHLI